VRSLPLPPISYDHTLSTYTKAFYNTYLLIKKKTLYKVFFLISNLKKGGGGLKKWGDVVFENSRPKIRSFEKTPFLVLKIRGSRENLLRFVEYLRRDFEVFPTSRLIEDENGHHIFLLLRFKNETLSWNEVFNEEDVKDE
jgi:hypothetical protein